MADLSKEIVRDIERAADLLLDARYPTCLTGAGVSVESGIRPFRGPDGVWTEHGEPPMDGYQRMLADPVGEWRRWIKREGYIKGFFEAFENAKPNPGHYALAELEAMGVLKFLVTQNVDGFHRMAGSKNVAEIHGNFWLFRCIGCGRRYEQNEIEISLDKLPPRCPSCQGIIKNDGVYFGEPIPHDVLVKCEEEVGKTDCMLVVGTSVFVYPAAGFPFAVKRAGGTLIEVNRYGTELGPLCNVVLQGASGVLLPELVKAVRSRLG